MLKILQNKRLKTFVSDMNIGKISELEVATQWDSQTKGSSSPK